MDRSRIQRVVTLLELNIIIDIWDNEIETPTHSVPPTRGGEWWAW